MPRRRRWLITSRQWQQLQHQNTFHTHSRKTGFAGYNAGGLLENIIILMLNLPLLWFIFCLQKKLHCLFNISYDAFALYWPRGPLIKGVIFLHSLNLSSCLNRGWTEAGCFFKLLFISKFNPFLSGFFHVSSKHWSHLEHTEGFLTSVVSLMDF